MKEGILTAGISFILMVAILIGGIWFLTHNVNKEEAKMNTQDNQNKKVREPVVAGQYYLADGKALAKQVNGFLAGAEKVKMEGKILGLIAPHAGYEFSGQVAATAFAQLAGENIETVILLGNSHHQYFEGAAVYSEGSFKTPLGEIEVDADLAKKIVSHNGAIKADDGPHDVEQILEVEIPFLQQTLKKFKIVPILFGNTPGNAAEIVAQAISQNINGKNILVVASSDMSHYPPYEKAKYVDKKTLEAILTGEVKNLETAIAQLEKEQIANTQTFLCSADAVKALMLVMKNLGAVDIKLLKYANSGDVAGGDRSQVVGYGAIGFYGWRPAGELTVSAQARLIDIARQTVTAYATLGRAPSLEEKSIALNQKLGAFVTLKKSDQLRGCIGVFTGENNLPLWQTVAEMAKAAAFSDPRFSPVKAEELKDLEYEVSVLSPLEQINDWRKIELGKHGVEIKKGSNSGVFLPQVATETGWDLETFLGQLCSQKAGLPWDCWKDKETDIYTFTAQIISE